MNPWGLLFWRGLGIFGVAAVLSLIWYRGGLVQYFRQTGWLGLSITFFFFICLPITTHPTSHDNVNQDRLEESGGSIANIHADGTFTHAQL